MKDQIERWEEAAERHLGQAEQPDGRLKCSCDNIFDPNSEGGYISDNPYSMPVCSKCFEQWYRMKHGFKKSEEKK